MKKVLLLVSLISLCLSGCLNRQAPCGQKADEQPADNSTEELVKPRYAEGFTITCRPDGVRLVEIKEPTNKEATPERFALVPKGKQTDTIPAEYQVISIPVERVICMTTPQLAAFSATKQYDKVVGMSNTRRMQNKEWLNRLKDGRIKRIGIEGAFDTEIIIDVQPDIIFVSPNRRGGYEVMKELGIPLIPHWGFKETSPLGLSEWIKLVGAFTGCEEKAIQLFSEMEKRYNDLKAQAAETTHKPTVFSGEIRYSNWYVPGGQSFYARLFADAGADYFMKDNPDTGGILLDFETVYSKSHNVEFWRVMNGYKGTFSYDALKESNPMYADFRAWKEKKVVYCNLEYIPLYENLPLSPDILLADMIKAFHPQLIPDYEPVFYKLLK